MMNFQRMWINQPSTLQQFHKYHGLNVLALVLDEKWAEVWFTSGDTHAMDLPIIALSKGWLNKTPNVRRR